MLRISELTKTYPNGVQALRNVSLDIPAGMFGLLGANGAGKTTLMKIAATLLEADSGKAELDGIDLISDKLACRRLLGYLPQEFGLYPSLTAEQTLDYLAKLKGVVNKQERRTLVAALLERVNLAEYRQQRVGTFSGGMKQRLGIAQTLIGQPRLIIVDEPTAGLDPEERVRFHNLLAEMVGADTVVILSTHIVSDVSNLCGQMAIIRKGEIIASCTPYEATSKLKGSIWEALVVREQLESLPASFKVISTHGFEGRIRMRVFSKGGPPSEAFTVATPTLEDYYFTVSREL
jgi:ABC-2 type transport system ATP-binding protein